MYLIAFPLLLIPFALYNMVAFLLDLSFDDTLFELPLLEHLLGGQPFDLLAQLVIARRQRRGSP